MPRILAVADSDSYLKWTAATLAGLPGDWERHLVVLRSPVQPSPRQIAAALDGAESLLLQRSWPTLLATVRRMNPDLIMLGCTGPVVEFLSGLPMVCSPNRILISGLPGMSWPASPRAVRARRRCDVFVTHSRRERAAFTALAAAAAPRLRVALSRLPFLDIESGPPADDRHELVFAAQAQVPAEREQRIAILRALAAVAPPRRVVVKLRARTGEQQTHRECWPYEQLWAELAAEQGWPPDRIAFSDEPMAAVLRRAEGLVTVSSTAALEAMAAGVPTVALEDFGVSARLINLAYADSGCLGSLADVVAGRLHRADPGWLADNYLHPAAEDDLIPTLEAMLAARPVGPRDPARPSSRRVRQAVRLLVPPGISDWFAAGHPGPTASRPGS